MLLDATRIQEILPHRYPFLFVDAVRSFDPEGPSLVALKLVSMSDPILQGHFPGFPIVPGVVQVEALAQAAVILASLCGQFDRDTQHCLFLGIDKARFRAPAQPGEALELHVTAERLGRVGKFSGQVRVGDELKCSASFMAAIQAKADAGAASSAAGGKEPA